MGKCYQIAEGHHLYEEMLSVFTVCSAIYTAAQVHGLGSFSSSPSDGLVIECRHLKRAVVLPLHGFIELALHEKRPPGLGIGLLTNQLPRKHFQIQTNGFDTLFARVIHPYVVNLFERRRSANEARFSKSRLKWTDSWQMGWLVRNALSHNGRVHFNLESQPEPKPVSWHGLSFDKNDQGRPLLGSLINAGDLIVLSIEMTEDLDGPLPYVNFIQR